MGYNIGDYIFATDENAIYKVISTPSERTPYYRGMLLGDTFVRGFEPIAIHFRKATDDEVSHTNVTGKKPLHIDLKYPRTKGSVNAIDIDLIDVRASDGIRVEYDFDRDGWVISQPTKLSWDADDPDAGNPQWKESAFVPSWQYIKEDSNGD